jgi:hypothetical protein
MTTFTTAEGLRDLLNRLEAAGPNAWRDDPEAEALMTFTIGKYRPLAFRTTANPRTPPPLRSRRCEPAQCGPPQTPGRWSPARFGSASSLRSAPTACSAPLPKRVASTSPVREDAAQRQEASRFGADANADGVNAAPGAAPRGSGDVRAASTPSRSANPPWEVRDGAVPVVSWVLMAQVDETRRPAPRRVGGAAKPGPFLLLK